MATMAAIISTPVQTPALNMPPITSQPGNVKSNTNNIAE
jgi:hypothetical protein